MNSTDNSQQPMDELERGIPSVNETKPTLATSNLRIIIFIFIVGIVGGFVYWKYYHRTNNLPQATAKKLLQLTSAVPARTFTDPPEPTSLEAPLITRSAVIPTAPSLPSPYPVITAAKSKLPQNLDKSASPLMSIAIAGKPTDVSKEVIQPEFNPQEGSMAGLLSGTHTVKQQAEKLGNRNFILAKGSFIDAALQTRLDSTVPGMTACVVTRNIYSDNGKVLLIERGSTISGEYRANLSQGMSRIFVLWTRIKTPHGVIISLDSPGTDQLGGSGILGYIDNHFWQRFGGALLLSLVDDAMNIVNTKIAQEKTNQLNFSSTSDATQDMATEALKNTINIPPTLYKNQGEQIGIYVARDLDFSKVYDVIIP